MHLTSAINVGRVKEIQLDRTTAPKLLTSVERHRDYQQRYRLQFRIFADESNIEITPDSSKAQGLVSHNVAFECKSLAPSWVLAKTEEEESNGRLKTSTCFLYPRTGPASEVAPNSVSIQVSAGSKEMQYMKDVVFSFPYASAFILHSPKELLFSRANRTRTIKVTGSSELKTWVDDPTLVELKRLPAGYDNQLSLQFSIPREVERSFKRVIAHIENTLTGQTEQLALTYFHEYIDVNHGSSDSEWNFSLTELGTVIILIVTLIIAVRLFIWPSNRHSDIPPGPQAARFAPAYRTPIPAPRAGFRPPTSDDKLRTLST